MIEAAALRIGERLLISSLEGGVVIALVWLLCRSLPGMPAALQSTLWWMATLKLVVGLLPVPMLEIPVLPAHFTWRGEAPLSRPPALTHVAGVQTNPLAGSLPHTDAAAPSPRGEATSVGWMALVVGFWMAVVLLHAIRLIVARRRIRGVIHRSVPWPRDDAAAVAYLASLVGLKRMPPLHRSPEIHAPQVAGLWRPLILMPSGRRELTPDERAMTLCHELMHIRRHDLVFGWIPALAERVFFFHPLARIAAGEYVTARESACDAAVLRALGVAPADYGRMLVRLGVAVSEPALTAGGCPSSRSSLKRRLEMLDDAAPFNSSRRSIWMVAAIVCALIPLQLAAERPQRPADAPAVPTTLETAAPALVRAAPATPARAAAPTAPAPIETAALPAKPAAVQDTHVAIIEREFARALETVVRRFDQAEALRQKASEVKAMVELQRRAAEQEQLKRAQISALGAQLDQMRVQLEIVSLQIRDIAEAQKKLRATERELSEQTGQIRRMLSDLQRMRKALEAK